MDTILYVLLVPVVFSALFMAVRIYFLYFAKPKSEDAKDKRLVEMYCGTEPAKEDLVAKPKRGRKPKFNGEDLGDFALKSTEKLNTKKKASKKKP
jgi:hypothetical protein